MKSLNISLITLYGIENRGIRHICANLKQHGHSANLIFFKEWRNNRISPPTEQEMVLLIDLLREKKTDLVGMGFGSSYVRIAERLTKKIHEKLNLPVIWGGIHVTSVPEECIAHCDFLCLGEGEIAMLNLANRMARDEVIVDLPNLWGKKNGEIFKNDVSSPIQDLNSIPFPDLGSETSLFIEKNRLHRNDPIIKGSEYRIIASRGCPFNCSYCYNSILRKIYQNKGNYLRIRSVENVIEELHIAKRKMRKLRRIKLDDDTFYHHEEWTDEFCRRYKKEIRLPFDCFLHPNLINEERILQLKDAGLQRVEIGIESGSEKENKEVYNRSSSNEQVKQFTLFNKKSKLEIFFDILVDNPLSTTEEKRKLFEFLMDLSRPFNLYILSLNFFPKTSITEDLLKNNIISEDDVEGRSTKSFRQYRVSLNYPRPKEDIFWISLMVLLTKSFIPKSLIWRLSRSQYLKNNPTPLLLMAKTSNLIKMLGISLVMLYRRELTFFKIRQYGSLRELITQ